MANVVSNSFSPAGVRSQSVPSATNFGVSVDRQASADFIQNNGNSNPLFAIRTQAETSPLRPRDFQRGYIRRADVTATGGNGRLNFMYNPPSITRDYLSYMDQAAIDPYNTLFQSGNSVAPPSMVQFSFDMVFDRQVEAATNLGDRGALVDMDYFDLVVRNIPPTQAGNTDVPDNGVMMLNPQDIVVVFGQSLTVQGRPINSRVQYSKFNGQMVPTVITISLTMIITYFGPLRAPFGLESGGQIQDYQALVPYPEVSGPLDFLMIQKGIDAYNTAVQNNDAAVQQYQQQTAAQNMASFGGGVAGSAAATLAVSNPASSATNAKAAFVAYSTFVGKGTIYSQAKRTQIPQYADCSSLVWYCYNNVGAASVFGPSKWPSTAAMASYWRSSGYRTVQQLMHWGGGGGDSAQLLATAQPGDLLFIQEAGGHHIGIVWGVAGSNVRWIDAASPTSNPNVGLRDRSAKSVFSEFRQLLRPVTSGSSTAANAGRLV